MWIDWIGDDPRDNPEIHDEPQDTGLTLPHLKRSISAEVLLEEVKGEVTSGTPLSPRKWLNTPPFSGRVWPSFWPAFQPGGLRLVPGPRVGPVYKTSQTGFNGYNEILLFSFLLLRAIILVTSGVESLHPLILSPFLPLE